MRLPGPNQGARRTRPSLRTLSLVTVGLAVLAVLVVVGIVAAPGLVGGDASYVVLSESMQPTIDAGDVVITREVPPEQIEAGDVVTFHPAGEADSGYVTHRVEAIYEEDGKLYFETRGDANDVSDGLVPAAYARGTLHLHLPYVGHLLLFARSALGLAVLVFAPATVLIASGVWQLISEFDRVPTAHVVRGEARASDRRGRLSAIGGWFRAVGGRLNANGGWFSAICGRLRAIGGRFSAIGGRLRAIGGRFDRRSGGSRSEPPGGTAVDRSPEDDR